MKACANSMFNFNQLGKKGLASAGLALSATVFAAGVVAPAGTQIGNQGSISFVDADGRSHSVASNLVNIEVLQVHSQLLEQNRSQPAVSGGQVAFAHTVTNTGNGDDTFSLSAINLSGEDDINFTSIAVYADDGSGNPTGSPITDTGLLAAGETFNFIVVAQLPEASDNQTASLVVASESQGDAAIVAENVDTAVVSSAGILVMNKEVSATSADPGTGTYRFTFELENTGGAPVQNVRLNDVLDDAFAYEQGSGQWSNGGTTIALTDEPGDTQSDISYDYDEGQRRVSLSIGEIAVGDTHRIHFDFSVPADAFAGEATNSAEVRYEDGSGSTIDGTTNTVGFDVNQVAGPDASDRSPDGATVSNEDGVSGDNTVTQDSAPQGGRVTFQNIITNTGNGNDTFEITLGNSSFPNGSTLGLFQGDGFTPLQDSNGDGNSDTGVLQPGESFIVVTAVQLAADAGGDNNGAGYSVAKTATSVFDPSQSNVVIDQLLNISADSVDLTLGRSLENGAGSSDGQGNNSGEALQTDNLSSGASLVYELWVNNTGASADNYSIGLTQGPQWPIVYYIDNGNGVLDAGDTRITDGKTGVVAAGEAQLILAELTVPESGQSGAYDLQFEINSAVSGSEDSLNTRVVVDSTSNVEITPPQQAGTTTAGGTVTYAHVIENNGNLDEQVTLNVSQSTNGWSETVFIDVNGNGVIDGDDIPYTPGQSIELPAGESVAILVEVKSPADAQQDDSNQTFVSVSYNGGQSTAGPATDTTTINAGYAELLKTQAPDYECDGIADGEFAVGSMQLKPGQCAVYRLTGINTSSAAVTNVEIGDFTPPFTHYTNCGGVCPAITSMGEIAAEPALGGEGEVRADIDQMPAGSSATLQFTVKLND